MDVKPQPLAGASKIKKYGPKLLLAAVLINLLIFHFMNKSHLKFTDLEFDCPLQVPQVDVTTENRNRLESILRAENLDLVLLPSAPRGNRPESDMELPGWRQTSNMMYLMGEFDISDSFLLLNTTCSPMCLDLFLPQQTRTEIVFSGQAPDKEAIKKRYNLNMVAGIESLPAFLKDLVIQSPSANVLDLIPTSILPSLKQSNVTIKPDTNGFNLFIESRFYKTPAELALLEYSSQVASFAHSVIETAIKKFRKKLTETQIASLFEYASNVCKCRLQAYNPIVGAGEHGAVLHFPTGETEDDGVVDIGMKKLILIDAAGAYHGYASDLTRTYSRKSFNEKDLLSKIVYDAQQAGIKEHKLGNMWSDVVNAATVQLTRGLWEKGFLKANSLEELVDSGVISIFMPHGIGHPVGLDVHDPVPLKWESVVETSKGNDHVSILRQQAPLKLKRDYPISIGHVHTVEPGVYFIPYLLNMARTNTTVGVSEFINWDMVDQWKDMGGVRIEDVIAIGYDGKNHVLTAPVAKQKLE